MNLANQIRGVYKVGMSIGKIATLLCDIVVNTYTQKYTSNGKITASFRHIGIYNTQKWRNILRNDLKKVIRTQLYEKLKLVECIENVINHTSSDSEEFKKLEYILNSDKSVNIKTLSNAFYKALLRHELDEIQYTGYELLDFAITTQPSKQDAHKIIRYAINACFSVTEYKMFKDVWLCPFSLLPVNVAIIREELKYVKMMLKKCDKLTDVNIYLLSSCLYSIIGKLSIRHQEDVLEETLALSHLIPTNLQSIFVDKIFEFMERKPCLSLEKFVKIVTTCLNEGIGTAETMYSTLRTTLDLRADDDLLLTEIALLDNKSLIQLRELCSILKTFAMI